MINWHKQRCRTKAKVKGRVEWGKEGREGERQRERLYQKLNIPNHRYLKKLLKTNINGVSPTPYEVINLPQPEI